MGGEGGGDKDYFKRPNRLPAISFPSGHFNVRRATESPDKRFTPRSSAGDPRLEIEKVDDPLGEDRHRIFSNVLSLRGGIVDVGPNRATELSVTA